MSSQKIYLSREGRTFGPISDAELRKFRESGRLLDYMWIWQSPEAGWQALHAMPSAPMENLAQPLQEIARQREPAPAYESPRSAATPSTPSRKPVRQVEPARPLEAVLHDFHQLVTGQIRWVSENGCELSCAEPEAPHFREKAPLVLNLLDPATGMTMNVRAKLGQLSRQQGQWTYELTWDEMPEMIAA